MKAGVKCMMVMALLLTFSTGFAQPFASVVPPPAPDYSLQENWIALPFHRDAADFVPKKLKEVPDSTKEVDVFYIYPTVFRDNPAWNADVKNADLKKVIEEKPIKFQASVFNENGRIYSPLYRQANIKAFFDRDNGPAALDLAYGDVKRAFEYYLKNYNNGRPFIIASHSQGTKHAIRLLQELIDTTALRNRMVAAYIIGFPVFEKDFRVLRPCGDPNQTGCYIDWACYKDGFIPPHLDDFHKGSVCVNPITWTLAKDTVAPFEKHKGMMLFDFNKKIAHNISTTVKDGYLWVKSKNALVRSRDNLHIGDINLFWYDIRANVKDRISAFWK
jgi:hypothetical protein